MYFYGKEKCFLDTVELYSYSVGNQRVCFQKIVRSQWSYSNNS